VEPHLLGKAVNVASFDLNAEFFRQMLLTIAPSSAEMDIHNHGDYSSLVLSTAPDGGGILGSKEGIPVMSLACEQELSNSVQSLENSKA